MPVQPQTKPDVKVYTTAVGAYLEKEPIHQIISICAGETSPGRVMMWVLIIALIGVVFHGPHGKGINIQPPSQEESCP
jgi:hypothetical protein